MQKKQFLCLGLGFLLASASASQADVLPAGQRTLWQPGITYTQTGGIPHRTQQCGPTLSPSGGDDGVIISNAIDNCGTDQVVQLSAGNFLIRGGHGIEFFKSHVTLRGTLDANGRPATFLSRGGPGVDRDPASPVITMGGTGVSWSQRQNDGSIDPGASEHIPLATDGALNSYTVTLASMPSPALQVGELAAINIGVNDLVNWGSTSYDSHGYFQEWERPIGQIVHIADVNTAAKQVTFTAPLHFNFRVSDQAQFVRFKDDDRNVTVPLEWSGVEDLAMVYGTGGDSGGSLLMAVAKYCWVKNVESDKTAGAGVHLIQCFRCEVRDSYFHTTVNATPGGDGYGIDLNTYSADNLVENNISWNFIKVMLMRATGGGNVAGYNYMQDGWIDYEPSYMEAGINAAHMAEPHFELLEGNEAVNVCGESTGGGSVYITVFRNHLTLSRLGMSPLHDYTYTTQNGVNYYEDMVNRYGVQLGMGHYYYAFVGNVLGDVAGGPLKDAAGNYLGYDGMMLDTRSPHSPFGQDQTAWIYQNDTDGDGAHVPMWDLNGWDNRLGYGDSRVGATTYRHGNYDYATHSLKWDPGNSDHNIPASLYIPAGATPAFMGSVPLPWVTPENASQVIAGELPAKTRFYKIMGVARSTDEIPPARPKGLRSK